MLKDYINNKPRIESERLILRPFEINDVNDLKEWTAIKDIYKYWGKNPGKYDLNPELLISKPEKPSKSFHLYIENRKDNKVIGDIYIYLIERDIRASLGIRLNPKYQNMGFGTEACISMVNWCFDNTELETIWSEVNIENTPSIKLLDKCGFKKIKKVEQGKMVSTVCNYYIYELHKYSKRK